MVVAVRRPRIPQMLAQGMRPPPKPRSPFGNGASVFGGMPSYIANAIKDEPMAPMGGDFEALMAELNASAPKPKITVRPPTDAPYTDNSGYAMPEGGVTEAEMMSAPVLPNGGWAVEPKAQEQQRSPALDIFSQKYEKPKPGWGDALGLVGGALMDLDGTLGSGNMARAQGMMQQRADESRAEFEQRRQEQIMQLAAQGDETALAMLDPLGNRAFQYGVQRDGVQDARYLDETQYGRGRDALADSRYIDERDYGRTRDQVGDTRWEREFNAAEAARRAEGTPRNIWQSAGEGVIFNQATGEYQNVAPGGTGSYGGAGGGGYEDPNAFMIPTSAMNENPFIQMQFGGNLTQGAPSFFDNGEIYQPGAADTAAAPGGGRPPNVTATYDRYRSSELAKNDNKELGNARTEAVAVTTNLLPQIQEMRSLVGTFPMGITSDVQYQVGRVAGDAFGLGMSPEEQGNRDAFRGQAKKLALSLGRDLKPFSNSDRDWIEAMVANPGNTEQSAEKVLDTLEKMAQYRLFYAQGAEMWQNQYGGLSMTDKNGKNFFESWGEWSAMNPVTGKQFSKDAPTSGPAGGGAKPPKPANKVEYDSYPSGTRYEAPDGSIRVKP